MTINYDEIKGQFLERKKELSRRLEEIDAQKVLLEAETFEIQREMIGIDSALEAMDFVKKEDDVNYVENTEAPGFTEQIKRILQQSNMPLLPTQIRDALLTAGHKGSSLKNMLISVHTVLTRLKPFLEEVPIDGRTAYKWKHVAIGRAWEHAPVSTNSPLPDKSQPTETTGSTMLDIVNKRRKSSRANPPGWIAGQRH